MNHIEQAMQSQLDLFIHNRVKHQRGQSQPKPLYSKARRSKTPRYSFILSGNEYIWLGYGQKPIWLLKAYKAATKINHTLSLNEFLKAHELKGESNHA